jgi:Ni/Co efflux regulator RcnB
MLNDNYLKYTRTRGEFMKKLAITMIALFALSAVSVAYAEAPAEGEHHDENAMKQEEHAKMDEEKKADEGAKAEHHKKGKKKKKHAPKAD